MIIHPLLFFFFFFNDTATTEIYTLSLHDALPISADLEMVGSEYKNRGRRRFPEFGHIIGIAIENGPTKDRKSTRLNSSHLVISYAVFCLKKKKTKTSNNQTMTVTYHIHASIADCE